MTSKQMSQQQLYEDPFVAYSRGVLAEIKEVWGPSPVLSSEDAKAYDKLLLNLIRCFLPQDFMQKMLIKETADSSWEQARYGRHKPLVVERRFRAKRLAETKAERATEPEEALDGLVKEVDTILLEPATELDHARALEVGIRYYEHLDNLQMTATARRNNSLDQLDRHQERRDHFMNTAANLGLVGLRAYEVSASPEEDQVPEEDQILNKTLGFPQSSSSETKKSDTPPDSTAS
jgi:hypothetical protein